MTDLENSVTVLYFTASWCGPCRALAPVMQQAAEDYTDRLKIVKIDVDEKREIAITYGIRSVPTLILQKGSVEVSRHVGAMNREAFDQFVAPALVEEEQEEE